MWGDTADSSREAQSSHKQELPNKTEAIFQEYCQHAHWASGGTKQLASRAAPTGRHFRAMWQLWGMARSSTSPTMGRDWLRDSVWLEQQGLSAQ